MIKKFKTIIIATYLLSILLVPMIALAADNGPIGTLLNEAAGSQGAGYKTSETDEGTGLAILAGMLVRMFLSLLGVIFISYTIYGGFLWMTAAGNDEQVKKGKNVIRDGVIGLIVVLSAASIYIFITQAMIGLRPTVDLAG
ncbi:MAG: hypothetical protein WCW26_00395 [Candidatus Buchananbacteria bacterium]